MTLTPQSLALSWSEFVVHYKLIKHVTELSSHSIYGEHSFYLHIPTKSKVFVKEITFSDQDQLNYIIQEINQATSFNQCSVLSKLIKYCVKLEGQVNNGIYFNEKSENLHFKSVNNTNFEQIKGNDAQNLVNRRVQLERCGVILVIYESERSLQQVVKQMSLPFSKSKENSVGISPSRYPTFGQITGSSQSFSQKTLTNILNTSIHLVQFLRSQSIDSIKGLTMEMFQIYHLGCVDEKCRFFLYPFMENQLIEMVRNNQLQIESVFVGENVLKMINRQEQQSVTRREKENEVEKDGYEQFVANMREGQGERQRDSDREANRQREYQREKQREYFWRQENRERDNEFAHIQLSVSPTFGNSQSHSLSKMQQESNQMSAQSVCIELVQSIGLMLAKLMLLSISKQNYLSSKLYSIDSNYELIIDFNSILASLNEVKATNSYSKHLMTTVETLIFRPSSLVNKLHQIIIMGSNPTPNPNHQQQPTSNNSRNASVSKSINNQKDHNKSTQKHTIRPQKSPIKLTPNKHISSLKHHQLHTHINTNKQQPLSSKQHQAKSKKYLHLNSSLKEDKIFINPYNLDKSQSNLDKSQPNLDKSLLSNSNSKQKHKSASFHMQKPNNISFPQPKQFSPTPFSKQNSSGKKPHYLQRPQSSNKKQQSLKNNLPQAIVQKLKVKILYDKNGKLYPNMIQKKFRDGSTYYGQYNPQLNIKQGNGLYFYYEGDVYGGTWKDNQLNGLGIYYFANGDSYQGEVVNGEKEGLGVYNYANGNVYTGAWKADKKQGEGHMAYANGDTYEGYFVDGRKQGTGTYTWLNGDVYEGEFMKNVKHGKGKFIPAHSNSVLECFWEHDRIAEKNTAKIIYKGSDKVYEGQIKPDGTIEGVGKLMFGQNGQNGQYGHYQGTLRGNKYEGECVIKYANGDIYKGQIVNNLFSGYGEYYFEARRMTYAGYWHCGEQQGEGRLIDSEKSQIIGNWRRGVLNGRGMIRYWNGERYEGEINENGKHGNGKYLFVDGNWIQARFENNTLVHVFGTS